MSRFISVTASASSGAGTITSPCAGSGTWARSISLQPINEDKGVPN